MSLLHMAQDLYQPIQVNPYQNHQDIIPTHLNQRTCMHCFHSGKIWHKRFSPKKHNFAYPFFLLDIDVSSSQNFLSLQNKWLGINTTKLLSFKTQDHFGTHMDFLKNIADLMHRLKITGQPMRFITLPRIFNFVFNPISILIIGNGTKPTHLLAEVHNYNGGRTVYPVPLKQKGKAWVGEATKDMYVSPLFDYDGTYGFELEHDQKGMRCTVCLIKDNQKVFEAGFNGKSSACDSAGIWKILSKHLLLTFAVVTRTLWQTLRLKIKGIIWHTARAKDQEKRF